MTGMGGGFVCNVFNCPVFEENHWEFGNVPLKLTWVFGGRIPFLNKKDMEPLQISFLRTVGVFFFFGAVLPFVQAQGDDPLFFIDSLREVLSRLEIGSEKQNEVLLELKLRIHDSKGDKSLTQEEQVRLMDSSMNLSFKRGEFSFLNPDLKPPDTLNIEMVGLENELKQLQDSISNIQSRLILLIEDENQTRSTKERATQLLATIHKEEVLKYLFENEKDLGFGIVSSEMDDQEFEFTSRTALASVLIEYDKSENWLLFPFLFQSINRLDYCEIGLFFNILSYPSKYKSPWLLLEFMYENASPESKPVISEFISEFELFQKPK